MVGSRRKARLMPVGKRAGRRVCGEIRRQPPLLGGTCLTSPDRPAVAIERDEVPAGEIEAVVAFVLIPRGSAEVSEVAAGERCLILVIAGRRVGDALLRTPRLVVRAHELIVAGCGVLLVTDREHASRT